MPKVGSKRPRPFSRSIERRPSHIVVFRKPSERNLDVLTRVLGGHEASEVETRSGVVLLRSNKEGPSCRLFQRLAVATADLDDKTALRLDEQGEVSFVARNEIRSIPRPVDEAALVGRSGAGRPSDDVLVAYIQGAMDALSGMMRVLSARGGGGVGQAPPQSVRSLGDHSWCLDAIGIDRSYNAYTGKGVKAAVLDTGVDIEHADFRDRFEKGVNAVSFVQGEDVQDGNGHGTHCAGVVGGPLKPSRGPRYGVAPLVDLLIGKVLNNAGSGYDSDIIDGIDWAVSLGASVVSMSLGSRRKVGEPFSRLYEDIAERLLESGTLLVAAAGNGSSRPWYTSPVENPAAAPSIMAVAAVDERRMVASFSCRQMDEIGEVNVSAPGVAVHSSWTGGGYRLISGTSMATPHVAGLAALYLEQNPAHAPRDLWHLLEDGAAPLGDPADFGRGLAQAPGA